MQNYCYCVGADIIRPQVMAENMVLTKNSLNVAMWLLSCRGVHRTPALMDLFVLCVCYDVMKIVYSNVAANLVRQSYRLQNRFDLTRIICINGFTVLK